MDDSNQFGHHYYNAPGIFIDSWGSGPMLMRHQGREWWFEFSERLGPTLLRKSDKEPAARQPDSDGHPFWVPFGLWWGGGRKCRAVRCKRSNRIRYHICHLPTPLI